MKSQTTKKRKTAHWRAAHRPEVRKLSVKLRRYWSRWDAIKRGDQLRDLINRGCSQRGLARDLGKSEPTIRRYLVLSSQSEVEREAFRKGETAKRILARKAARDRRRMIESRVREENKSGVLSDEIAEIILDFCLTRRGVPETQVRESGIPHLLAQTRKITRGLHVTRPGLFKLPKGITLVSLYRMARPLDYPGEYWEEHRAGWLSNILMAIAPELDIRESAITKAEERSYREMGILIRADLEEVWIKRLKTLLALPSQTQQP
jgi:predicted transcriptional regulator